MIGVLAVIGRDITLAFRAGGGALLACIFFSLMILLFALAVGPEKTLLATIAAPILWTAALLSTLVSFDRIFQSDFEDGSLDTLVETLDPLETVVLAKAVAHWLTTCLPLIVLTPVLGLMTHLPGPAFAPLLLSLAIGTPALSLIGSLASALTVALRRASLLVTILSAPLFTPVLIFGVGAADAGARGDPNYLSALMLLGAVSLVSLIIAPLAGAAAIRANLG